MNNIFYVTKKVGVPLDHLTGSAPLSAVLTTLASTTPIHVQASDVSRISISKWIIDELDIMLEQSNVSIFKNSLSKAEKVDMLARAGYAYLSGVATSTLHLDCPTNPKFLENLNSCSVRVAETQEIDPDDY